MSESINKNLHFEVSTIETIDKSVLNFVKSLGLSTTTNKGFQPVPIVWGTAERSFQAKGNKDIRDEQEFDTLVKCSEKAEDVKLGDMENWLDSQLANTNPNSQKHEHIFKLYNSISDIRTFYAQHLFNKKESV